MKNDITRFQGDNIKNIYPCGKGCVTGVPYARDKWNSGDFLERSGKTRDVNGVAAEKIAENVKKFDKETGVLTKAFMAMKRSFSK